MVVDFSFSCQVWFIRAHHALFYVVAGVLTERWVAGYLHGYEGICQSRIGLFLG